MFTRLTFRHKILLAASLVVIGVFSLFSFYAYSLQRQATTEYMEGYLSDLGQSTANSLQNWFSGRIALVQNLAQNLAGIPEYEVADLLNQPLMTSSFVEVFRGTADGGFIVRPSSVQITEGYDPRTRGWYRDALQKGTIITAPYVSANEKKRGQIYFPS